MLIRFGQGMCAGIISAIVPLIIKELAPFELSGFFGVFQQLFITIGIFTSCIFAYILGLMADDFSGESYWRLVFGFPLITISIQTILLFTIYNFETPKYLLQHNREAQARQLLQRFYFDEFVDEMVASTKAEIENSRLSGSSGEVADIGESEELRLPKIVSIHLALLQQLVGISAVSTYARKLAEGSL
jgi:MFS transporter, SP family, arabinose:H+ symporter